MKWLRTWAGGRVRELDDGTKRFYIQRRLGNGVRKSIALEVVCDCTKVDCAHEREAEAEFTVFKRDPTGYRTRKQHTAEVVSKAGVRLDPDTLEEFRMYLRKRAEREEITKETAAYYVTYLAQWGKLVGNRPLHRVTLDELKVCLKRWTTARHARIVALKAFTAWAREEKDAPKLHRNDDPTVDLKTPPVIPEKSFRPKGYPVQLVEKLYAALPSQAARDTICLRAKANGIHNTEIDRIARGRAELIRVSDPSGIEGVIVFAHLKKGKPHAVAVDAQTFAAAERMQVRGSAVSRTALKLMLDRVARRWHGCDGGPTKTRTNKKGETIFDKKPLCPKCTPIRPGELRHSFATWGVTIGEEVRPSNQRGVDLAKVSEAMGHLGKRTTKYFYVGDRVPNMIRIPIRLEHPEDPVLMKRETKERAG
jgi:integrase